MPVSKASVAHEAKRIIYACACSPPCTSCQSAISNGHGKVHCPAHDDHNASLSVSLGVTKPLVKCHANTCTQDEVVEALRKVGAWGVLGKTYTDYVYHDANGDEVYKSVRVEEPGKDKYFFQSKADGYGGWEKGMSGVTRLPYRLPELLAADPDQWVFVPEGEKHVDVLTDEGLVATCNVGGAGKWTAADAAWLDGRNVVVLPDNDAPGRKHGQLVARLTNKAKRLVVLDLAKLEPDLPRKGDVIDWLDLGHDIQELLQRVAEAPEERQNGTVNPGPQAQVQATPPPQQPSSQSQGAHMQAPPGPTILADVVKVFQKWLYLDSLKPLYAVLGTLAANYMPGDPVWLLVVGASGGGKTELVMAVSGLDDVKLASTLTEAALLSGTPSKSRAAGAHGGLLMEIGDFGILLFKDFTSVLSMSRDPRAQLLGALREIFDGYWVRHLGVDGGRTLDWTGKVGFIAGCTGAIDSHHAVLATMGERFLFARLPEISEEEQANRALANTGHEAEMRRELAEAVTGLFETLGDLESRTFDPLSDWEQQRLVTLSSLVARCRSAVERDSYNHEILLILDTEAPARLVQTLRRLYGGMLVIGLDKPTAWQTTVEVGLDSIPKVRRLLLRKLFAADAPVSTPDLATAIGYPTTTARRALEDLAAHRLMQRNSGGAGRPDEWAPTDHARAQWAQLHEAFPKS